ncbi:MAG: hypothetical protein NVSMB24_09990 [Mucilaginibacter sp.]
MDISHFVKLYNLFAAKKWNINDGHEIVFENYCKLFENLSDQQKELIYELSEEYLWVTFNKYQELLLACLDQVENEKLDGCKKIYVFPIMKPEDEGKAKSGTMLVYLFKGMVIHGKYKSINFEIIETFKQLEKDKLQLQSNELLFLVDDFMGSGETIEATLTEVLKNREIEVSKINVIALVAQSTATKFLDKFDIKYYIKFIRNKGISDFYQTDVVSDKISVMESIEKLIPANHFRFGYNESEALVTMIRTPDNTFPIFWKDHKKNGEKFEGPFARYV